MWKTTKQTVRASALLLGLFVAATQGDCSPVPNKDIGATIKSMVLEIEKAPDIVSRAGMAKKLSLFIRAQEPAILSNLDPATIDALSSLLKDKSALVQAWTALALGHIGPTASRAVPELERALNHREFAFDSPVLGKLGVSATAEAEIGDALNKVRGLPAAQKGAGEAR